MSENPPLLRLNWNEMPPKQCRRGAVAVGNFDGVHLGHASLVRTLREQADAVVRRLFKAYMTDSSALPPEWAAKADGQTRAQAVADYIAGMTDRFAIAEHARLFDGASDLR